MATQFAYVLLVFLIPVVITSVWLLLLKLLGVSKAELRRVGLAAAKRYLGVRDPPGRR